MKKKKENKSNEELNLLLKEMHHRDNLSENEKNFLNSLESDYKFKNNKNNIS